MAFPSPFGGSSSEDSGQEPPNQSEARMQKELADMNAKFEAQRTLLLQSSTTANQEISLLRKQLSEVVSRSQGQPTGQQPPAGQTDDWMSFLTSQSETPPAQPGQQRQPLSEQEVRRIYQEEENRKHNVHAQEVQKIEQLNARFAVEHPELAKDKNAVHLIRNQFLALSNVRPDLTAEQRYQFAIDNVVKDVMPNLNFGQPEQVSRPAKQQAAPKSNPYMPNVFAAPAGRGNVQDVMSGMVDHTPEAEKYANREKELLNWQKNRSKSLFGS